MSVSLFLLYYSTLVFSLLLYLTMRRKGMFTISDGIVAVTTLVITLGGYFNSYGFRYNIGEFNYRVFLDYFIFLIIVPIGLIIGNRIKIKNSLIGKVDFKVDRVRIKMLLIFILVYGFAYIFFIRESVPLFKLLSGYNNLADLAALRLTLTHDYDISFNVPFILRYYRLVINDMLRFVLAIVFLMYLNNKKKHKKIFAFVLLVSVFFHTYNFEKSGLIYIMLILFFDYTLYKGVSYKKIKKEYIKVGLIGITLMVAMYMGFMGAQSPIDALSRLFDRAILGQTAGVYYQDYLLNSNYNEILWGKGIPMFLVDSILNRDVVDLSGEAYRIINPHIAKQGLTGTAGGLPMFFLRSNFGYLIGTVFLFLLSVITGVLDSMLTKGLNSQKNRILITALYSVMIIYFIQAFMGNFTRVFMLPFLVSPQIIIVILSILFLRFGKRKRNFEQ